MIAQMCGDPGVLPAEVEIAAQPPGRPDSPRDLIIAWAIDCETNRPCYIGQLDGRRGAKCNCKCSSCGLPLTAVNAAKTRWKKRPHFRHPEGTERDQCAIIAARKALEAVMSGQHRILLPRRCRSARQEGLIGHYFEAWVNQPAEPVAVTDCNFVDQTEAILTLDDGRQLTVRLVGRLGAVDHGNQQALQARIEICVDDPDVAGMSPKEIMSWIELRWSEGCWLRHWNDDALDRVAADHAAADAANAEGWIENGDLPANLSLEDRRETLLHRAVKAEAL